MPHVGAPLPAHLLAWTAADGELVPAWLSDRDRPWLRELLAEAQALAGKPLGELATHWARSEPDPRAGRRWRIAVHVLLAWLRGAAARPAAATLRQALFAAAAELDPEAAWAQVAAARGMAVATLQEQLFADLPEQRPVPALRVDGSWLLLAANQALARGMLLPARSATLALRGASRAVLRTAWLHGQGLQVVRSDAEGALVTWQAPVQAGRCGARAPGRGLLALLPVLPWAQHFELRARVGLRGAAGTVVLATGDPLPPGPEPRTFDSALEAQFEAAFRAAAPAWQVVREPQPVLTSSGLAFPDFALRPPGGEPWLFEIAGLRAACALPQKLALLELPRCLLALPQAAVPAALAGHPRLVPFGRRVDPDAVRQAIASASADRRAGPG